MSEISETEILELWERVWKDFNFIQSNPLNERYGIFYSWDGVAGQSYLLRRIMETNFKTDILDYIWLKFEAEYDAWLKQKKWNVVWEKQQEWIQEYFRNNGF